MMSSNTEQLVSYSSEHKSSGHSRNGEESGEHQEESFSTLNFQSGSQPEQDTLRYYQCKCQELEAYIQQQKMKIDQLMEYQQQIL